ncbi:MAG: ABC transporter substrate-binding protein, partial [Candidatus Thorarchaeota archaeon]
MAISLSEERPAFIAWEPFPALAEYNGLAVPLLLSRDIWPLHPCCVLAVSDSFLAAHPDRVEKVVKIHKMAIEWITQHPEEALTIATQWLESPQAPVETAFNRIVYTYTLNVTDVRRYAEFLSSQGLIDLRPEEIDPFLDEFVNPEFIEA